ncbi:STAS domain-containing protein [Cronbergia sp. UHCC 0137]|uniref:STAS domain-containing protein n=1 Tax=Cronbergia sp. UHCC 0137 TaxID=3110239 RepID=UPI002B1FB956|nr:STAS domain-containing protein [Cronbergia sp. UHCC 0137]MEA5616297.1 STAS domain-containing protein [Cronbergia sp. UHCC 0137]
MTLTQERKVILFKPQGSIDLDRGTALSEQMIGVNTQEQQLWVIDLAEVDFMDSSGLVPLVELLKTARENSCRLVLCNVQTPVRLIFELTQLDSVFEIFNSYEDILAIAQNTQDDYLALAS